MMKHFSEADLLETYYTEPGQSMPVMMHLAECKECAARYARLDRKLREAGSYGELLRVALPREALDKAGASGEIVIRLQVDEALPGGLAIYGKRFGRYPLDPTLVFVPR